MWYNIRIMSEKGEKTKTTLREDAEARPLYFSLIFLLLAAACILFPTDWLSKYIGEMLALGIVRFVFGAAGIWFIFALKRGECFRVGKIAIKNFDIVLVSVLIAVNNFPIIALCRGEAFDSAGAGEIWNVPTIVLTAIFSVVAAAWIIFRFARAFCRKRKPEASVLSESEE